MQGLTERDLPNKEDFLASLHASLGSAHLELGNTELALEHFTQDLKIVEKQWVNKYHSAKFMILLQQTVSFSQLAHARARALCNVGKVYSMMGNYQKSLELYVWSSIASMLIHILLLQLVEESSTAHDIGGECLAVSWYWTLLLWTGQVARSQRVRGEVTHSSKGCKGWDVATQCQRDDWTEWR